MIRTMLAGLAAALCAVVCWVAPAASLELVTTIDLDYSYAQAHLGSDVEAETQFTQRYGLKYETSLTTAYDFIGAVRVELQDAWFTDKAHTSRVSPTLEMATKSSLVAAKIAYEESLNSTDGYLESADVANYSTSLSFEALYAPEVWPEIKLKYQRLREIQENANDSTTNSLEFSALKDIYKLRLEYNFRREVTDNLAPEQTGSVETKWSGKATYKDILWGGTQFELAYEISETYKDEQTRGVFSGDTTNYDQTLKTRVRNSLLIAPRMTLGLVWEYQYEQDLTALSYDYKLKNKYVLDLRWDMFDWLKILSEARHETDLTAAAAGADDERSLIDGFKVGFDLSAIPWLLVYGKAEVKNEGKVKANSGGSVDKTQEEKYELVIKNRVGTFWDFTWDATSAIKHTDGWLESRETKVKADLKLKLLGLVVTPAYEVSRKNEWERLFDFPVNQQQVREAKIKFDYQMQLAEMFKATFTHEYAIKVDDKLDEVLNFERILQFSENTRLNLVFAEFFREMLLEGEIERKATDTQDDPDPQLVELSYSLKLDWKIDRLSILTSIKYNDKGDTFDDVSFNAKAGWKGDRLEVTGEYQFDKIITDDSEPKDEKRKLSLKLNYKF